MLASFAAVLARSGAGARRDGVPGEILIFVTEAASIRGRSPKSKELLSQVPLAVVRQGKEKAAVTHCRK